METEFNLSEKDKCLGIAKKNLKAGDDITILELKDGRLISNELNCFESITIDDFNKLAGEKLI